MDISIWKEKYVDELSILELAYAHLGNAGSYRLKNGWLKSILPITLQEVNHARHMAYSKNFVPVVGAFGVIEQIGFTYKRSDKLEYSNQNASSINKALYYFAGFEEGSEDVKALYALRNSFLHNASLMAKALHSNKPSYYFQFDREIDVLVQYPDETWDGNILNFKPEYTTLINPEKVIDLARSIVGSARQCLEDDVLEVDLECGERELFYRFLKFFPD
ncbi:hypothetical protein [Marinobacterium sediminicola]|uniref:Abi-like protein n=1 Tax=Marinobacterium sediminicola TaxID=518898 RepID=A0ABY1S2G8_9GAMM|nr:hypothetical protein [Marinobacterium sediminicola]ULG70681.1 hypothetical protein LN244_07705 [Marinobacterium sediminicola]SMR77218.1 hypothetical protein SAMN04487964_11343 [Marinobacterium sediminicola]